MCTVSWFLRRAFARGIFGIFVHDVRERSTEGVEGIAGGGPSGRKRGRAYSTFALRHGDCGFKNRGWWMEGGKRKDGRLRQVEI